MAGFGMSGAESSGEIKMYKTFCYAMALNGYNSLHINTTLI
jgi:hypothetical protein